MPDASNILQLSKLFGVTTDYLLNDKDVNFRFNGKDYQIHFPLYVARFGEFGLDDEIIYEIGDRKHTFQVSGILEEMQYGNYGKGLMGAYLPNSIYEEFASEYKENIVTEYSIIADDNTEINALNNAISNLLKEKSITMLSACDKVSAKDTRTMVCNLLILVLLAFAMVILLVSVFLCKFRISNDFCFITDRSEYNY